MTKRFKRNIKNLKMLKKGDAIYYKKSSKPQDIFLEIMFRGMPYEVKKGGKRVSSDFLEILSSNFLKKIFAGTWPDFKVNGETLYPLYNFPYKEIIAFLNMKGIVFKSNFKQEGFLKPIIKKRPGALFSLSKWWYDRNI